MIGKFTMIVGYFVLGMVNISLGAEKPGTIKGTVRYTGTVPAFQKILTGDGGTIEHNDLIVDAKSKGLKWVGVVLEDAPAQPTLKETAEAEVMDQKEMIFLPRMLAVQAGRAIRFDNSDLCNHSVRAFATNEKNEMNVFVTAAKPVTKVFLSEKHPIKIGCTLHSWMTAWIFVVPHPWFAVTDDQGQFAIRDVPPGMYTLWFRHPDTGLNERRKIEVKPDHSVEVAIEWKEVSAPTKPK